MKSEYKVFFVFVLIVKWYILQNGNTYEEYRSLFDSVFVSVFVQDNNTYEEYRCLLDSVFVFVFLQDDNTYEEYRSLADSYQVNAGLPHKTELTRRIEEVAIQLRNQ